MLKRYYSSTSGAVAFAMVVISISTPALGGDQRPFKGRVDATVVLAEPLRTAFI